MDQIWFAEKNVTLITTDLKGTDVADIYADFKFSEDGKERTLVLTIIGINKPLFTSFAHLLMTVLFVTPIILLTSIGVNSYNRFFNRNAKNSFSFAFK